VIGVTLLFTAGRRFRFLSRSGRSLRDSILEGLAALSAFDDVSSNRLCVGKAILKLGSLSKPDIKHVLKEDAGLALNFDKTKILVKGISVADAHAAAQRILNADPSLAHLRSLLSPASFVVGGFIGLGAPIGLMLLSSTL
jgi:hypothetical protein